jgi:hypothetical protein
MVHHMQNKARGSPSAGTMKKHSLAASVGIKTVAATVRRSVGDQLRALQVGMPETFRAMPAVDRHAMIEELRAGLNIWIEEIDAVRAELRALLRQLQDESWD